VIAFSRPFWPLFLHVLGGMILFGALLTAVIASLVAARPREGAILQGTVLRRAAFTALVVGIPAFVVFRIAAQIIYSDEKDVYGGNDPTWIGIGFLVTDPGLLIFLAAIGCGYWWLRSAKPLAGRLVAGLSSVYLLLLAVAWLAMSGKWN
jgi:hypothetical protein